VIAAENEDRIFEDVAHISHFPMEEEDLASVGEKCQALGENLRYANVTPSILAIATEQFSTCQFFVDWG